jgi:geranylgeranyl diphosphate synthase type I
MDHPATLEFHQMLTYHMGWTGEGAGAGATGKRIRPILLLLSYLSCEPETPVEAALPAAAAIELVHNFSLVHDDIEDISPTRRGRPTVWKKWSLPLAVNAGDALFVIAHQAVMDIAGHHPDSILVRASNILQAACLELTRGQFLDMSFEGRDDITEDEYWAMISGKTAALISAACSIGAMLANAGEERQKRFSDFGHDLGLAFQVKDDILGIWGDEKVTGKSNAIDLIERKNSLPILYGLSHGGKFSRRWLQGAIQSDEVADVAEWLKAEGAYDYAQERAHFWTSSALENLRAADPRGDYGRALTNLSDKLLSRQQ